MVKRTAWRDVLLGWFLLCIGAAEAVAEPATIPAPLRDWVEWVKQEHADHACPWLDHAKDVDAEDAMSRFCAWPGTLRLDVHDQGARFTLSWDLYLAGAVQLPGDLDAWPQSVRANGALLPVIPDAPMQRPTLWLEPGHWSIEGELLWQQRPEALVIPAAVAQVRLSIDGKDVFPVEREGSRLWLGQGNSVLKEADTLDIKVFRLLTDSLPALLQTQMQLSVSGEGREETFRSVLPPGFIPVDLSGSLPARLDPDGTLRVQVRPGVHQLELSARLNRPLDQWSRGSIVPPWPSQEIWSYQGVPRLRVTSLSGVSGIDPAQAGVPADWAGLPAFLVESDTAFRVEERSRGLSAQDTNRLRLNRQLWLDFSGRSWTALDQVTGSMVRGWRLDMAAPFLMTRAETPSRGLLVTRGAQPQWTGVELREPQVQLTASARIQGTERKLPITGWQHAFENVQTNLNLPPGYRLYAALGADQAPQTWIMLWNLLDIFLVAILVLLAFAWWRLWGALLVLAYLLLAYHEPHAPLFTLMVAIVLGLFLKWLPAGRLSQAMRWAHAAAWAALVLWTLPFAAQQFRLALHPQLERDGAFGLGRYAYDGMTAYDSAQAVQDVAGPERVPMAPVSAEVAQEQEQKLENVEAIGSSMQSKSINQAVQSLVRGKRYASNTLIQAGTGNPNWNWNSYQLQWSGPVLPEQSVRLLICPPWLTGLLRALSVLLLAFLLLRFARTGQIQALWPLRARAAAAGVVGLVLASGVAQAQDWPSEEWLEALRERVLPVPECAPRCAQLARADVAAEGDRLRIALEVHVGARAAVPLVGIGKNTVLESLRVDGREEPMALLQEADGSWKVLDRGVHRLDLSLRVADADKLPLQFMMKPAYLNWSGKGWEANGLRGSQLLTNTLELVRVRSEERALSAPGGQDFSPYVEITRRLLFDIDWQVQTTVQRIAPRESAFSIELPLLDGERVTSGEFQVRDGKITVAMQAQQDQVTWQSQLGPISELTLRAPDLGQHVEVWQIDASPLWNVSYQGVPVVYPPSPQEWVHEFHPLPNEALKVRLAKPEAVSGASYAIDSASLHANPGKRTSDYRLQFELRSTQGGQHVIELPPMAEVLAVKVAGETLNARPEKGRLALPIKPGKQSVEVQWRTPEGVRFHTQTPAFALHAAASNLSIAMELPRDRWLLASTGPAVGPAILYWPTLAVLVLLASLLSRLRRTPLRWHDWLLLGLGFSMFSWLGLLLVVAWLLALDARARWRADMNPNAFNAGQLLLVALTAIAMVSLVGNLRQGLLGHPDMQVVGNGSNAFLLNWFHDRTDSAFPTASAYSVSIWWYKAAILLWALWLAASLARWLRWGWQSYSLHGYWRAVPVATKRAAAPPKPDMPSPPPAPGAASGPAAGTGRPPPPKPE